MVKGIIGKKVGMTQLFDEPPIPPAESNTFQPVLPDPSELLPFRSAPPLNRFEFEM